MRGCTSRQAGYDIVTSLEYLTSLQSVTLDLDDQHGVSGSFLYALRSVPNVGVEVCIYVPVDEEFCLEFIARTPSERKMYLAWGRYQKTCSYPNPIRPADEEDKALPFRGVLTTTAGCLVPRPKYLSGKSEA